MLDDLALFVRIVEGGSLSAAALALGIPAATLTRRLQKLEHLLDVAAQEPLLNGALP
ncbi:MAG: helix-turn-helix domain-containing protein [Iodobacter sp.]